MDSYDKRALSGNDEEGRVHTDAKYTCYQSYIIRTRSIRVFIIKPFNSETFTACMTILLVFAGFLLISDTGKLNNIYKWYLREEFIGEFWSLMMRIRSHLYVDSRLFDAMQTGKMCQSDMECGKNILIPNTSVSRSLGENAHLDIITHGRREVLTARRAWAPRTRRERCIRPCPCPRG